MRELNKADMVRMVAGAVFLFLIFLLIYHFYRPETSAEQLALKATRVDMVSRMRITLASASEAEKSAVLAITDNESQAYANQSRSATAEVERLRLELESQLARSGTQAERDLLKTFSDYFTEYRRIDAELLGLAVKNTNVKASNLAFGPAAASIDRMNSALSRLVSSKAGISDYGQILVAAYNIRIAALHMETLIPPHIAEENEKKMDELEAVMSKEDRAIRDDLNRLKASPALSRNTDLAIAESEYAQFTKIRSEIITLSRENTNVRSLSISLNQKNKVTMLCQKTLHELQQSILAEPIRGVTYGRETPR